MYNIYVYMVSGAIKLNVLLYLRRVSESNVGRDLNVGRVPAGVLREVRYCNGYKCELVRMQPDNPTILLIFSSTFGMPLPTVAGLMDAAPCVVCWVKKDTWNST